MCRKEYDVEAKRATGRKLISGSEAFALGHYPENPIYPGVLSVGLMTDLAERLVERVTGQPSRVEHLKRVQFLGMAVPGDDLEIEVNIKETNQGGALVVGTIRVGDDMKVRGSMRVVCEGPTIEVMNHVTE